MKKLFIGIMAVLILSASLSSCSHLIDSNTKQGETIDSTDTYNDHPLNNDISSNNTATEPNMEPELIHGIDIVEYPNPCAISEYNRLTDDQKVAFDALGSALTDILKNGPVPNKSYSLSKRINWYDYKIAYNLFAANFTATENIVVNLQYADSFGTQNHVDGIDLYDDEGRLDEYYQEYLDIDSEADNILASLDHDETEYGKALAIAQWMVDNIVYPADHDERLEDNLNTAYVALMKKEAVCDGYAKAYDFLCKKAGLETIYVTGDTVGGWHAWNMILIDSKWYHVDVTWMDNDGDFYRNFMMPDDICFSNGHVSAEYYWNQETNDNIIPAADSFDLYKYYYGTAEEAIRYFESIELYENVEYRVVFDDEVEKDRFIEKNEIEISDSTGKNFVLNIIPFETAVCLVYFINAD